MKKFLAFLAVISVLFLSSCVQKDLIDIYVFSSRFSRYSQNFQIDENSLTAYEQENEIVFPLTFGDDFLLSVSVNPDTGFVTSFSAVCMFKENNKLSDEDFSEFNELASSSVRAFTKIDSTDEIFRNLGFTKKSDVMKFNHTSYESGFYKYSLVSNELGIYFTSSTDRR